MNSTETGQPLGLGSTEGLGPLPPQREGQAHFMLRTQCGIGDDCEQELGHWLSPAAVQQRINAETADLRSLLARYRDETPLGHQPHMIAHQVDVALARECEVIDACVAANSAERRMTWRQQFAAWRERTGFFMDGRDGGM